MGIKKIYHISCLSVCLVIKNGTLFCVCLSIHTDHLLFTFYDALFCGTAVPFVRINVLMKLVVRGYLKGPFTEALRDKNEKVIEDYFSGGFNRKIALERQANATSNGVLNVGFRNLQQAEGRSSQDVVPLLSSSSSCLVVAENESQRVLLKGISEDATEAATSLQKVKESFVDFVETKIQCMRKEYDVKAEIAGKELQLEDSKRAFEIKKRKEMMELLLEEAETQRKCKEIIEGLLHSKPVEEAPVPPPSLQNNKKQRQAIPAASLQSSSLSSSDSSSSDDSDDSDDDSLGGGKEARRARREEVNESTYNSDAEKGLSKEQVAARRRLWAVLEELCTHDLEMRWIISPEILDEYNIVRCPEEIEYRHVVLERFNRFSDQARDAEGVANASRYLLCCIVPSCIFLLNFVLAGGLTWPGSWQCLRCAATTFLPASSCAWGVRCLLLSWMTTLYCHKQKSSLAEWTGPTCRRSSFQSRWRLCGCTVGCQRRRSRICSARSGSWTACWRRCVQTKQRTRRRVQPRRMCRTSSRWQGGSWALHLRIERTRT